MNQILPNTTHTLSGSERASSRLVTGKAMRNPVEPVSVHMTDGSVVEFTSKRKLVTHSVKGTDGRITVRIYVRNGETRQFTVPDSLRDEFLVYGVESKIRDSVAGIVDEDDVLLAIDDVTARLTEGKWNARGGNAGYAGASILARALATHFNKPIDEIREFLRTKTMKQKRDMRAHPDLLPHILAEEAKQGKKQEYGSESTDLLLAELQDDATEESADEV